MEPAHQLLHKLLLLWQSNPDSLRRKSLQIIKENAYLQTINPDDKDRLHDSLRTAERASCISLEWGKGHDNHLVKKIWLVDGPALASHLGEPLARDIAQESARSILEQIPNDPWLHEVLAKIVEQWDKNKPAYRMAPGAVDDIVSLLKALFAVKNNRQRGFDLRTFSARALGNSKAMERMQDRFTKVWNEFYDTGLDSSELFESLGLVKFPPMLCIKGPIDVRVGTTWLRVDSIPAYVGLPPDSIGDARISKNPKYVLTVENLASFNRHCREIQDEGIIVYTAGFLGPSNAPVLKLLDTVMPPSVPFYHWGDIDHGGLNIARHVQSLIRRTLRLHLMTPDLLRKFGKEPDQLGRPISIRKRCSNTDIESLADFAQSNSPYLVLEQENLDPCSPSHFTEQRLSS